MLESGTRIGPYEVTGTLGAGGMGEVYRARDTRLDREVALKILPEAFSGDTERLQRFEREAKTLASLNHPNIAQVFGFEQADGVRAIAMELVEGDTLEDRLAGSDLSLDVEAVALQVATALEAAHEAGIIHRDLKPANVKIRHDGTVKVLDFGLAKVFDPGVTSSADPSNSPTITSPATGLGVILGTAAYMSPEQARGRTVDRRADIWAFGVVLFELVTRRRLFAGDTVSDTLAAVLREEIPWDRLPAELAPPMRRVLTRCLERDPQKRLRDIGDARLELERPLDATPVVAGPMSARGGTGRSRMPERAAWLAGMLAVAGLIWAFRPAATTEAPWQYFTQLTDASGPEDFPVISPDGGSVAFVRRVGTSTGVYVQRIGGRNASMVADDPALDETAPAFSPDGQRIAYNIASEGGGVFVAGATGESARRLTDEGFHPAWSPDGASIVFCMEQIATPYGREGLSALWVVEVDAPGARPVKITDGDAVQPAWSPSGQRIAFWANDGGQRDIFTIAAAGGERVPVLQDAPLDWSPTWSPDGRYIYFASDRGGSMNLWRVAVDEATGMRQGDPEPVTMGVQAQVALPSFSGDGSRLVVRSLLTAANPAAIPLDTQAETVGEPKLLFRQTGVRAPTSVSPDGQWLAYANLGERREDVFISRIDGTDLRRLTDDDARDRWPVWSPDGRELAFYSNRSGQWAIWTVRPDGSGLAPLSADYDGELLYPVYDPIGTRLLAGASRSGAGKVVSFDLAAERPVTPVELARVEEGEFFPSSLSPDGRMLAGYVNTSRGSRAALVDLEARAVRLLDPDTAGLVAPTWLPDGRRLLIMTGSPVQGLGVYDLASGMTRALGSWPFVIASDVVVVAPDGRTIYVGVQESEADVWMVERER